MIKPTTKTTALTSFHGSTVYATVKDLEQVLGEPHYTGGIEDKVQNEWELELIDDDGSVFTIYDWKEYRGYDDDHLIEWHIGGHNKAVTERAKDELKKLLTK